MNVEVVEKVVNEVFDNVEVREVYTFNDLDKIEGELIGFCIEGVEYKFVCVNNLCLCEVESKLYGWEVDSICKNDDDLREYLANL